MTTKHSFIIVCLHIYFMTDLHAGGVTARQTNRQKIRVQNPAPKTGLYWSLLAFEWHADYDSMPMREGRPS